MNIKLQMITKFYLPSTFDLSYFRINKIYSKPNTRQTGNYLSVAPLIVGLGNTAKHDRERVIIRQV